MKTLSKAFFATTLCLLTAVPAYAAHPYRNDDYRERMQQLEMRIECGVDRHQLNRKDAKVLHKESRQIRRMAKEFREDGHLSRRERHRLDYEMARLNDQITRYQRNDTERYRKTNYSYGYHRPDSDRAACGSFYR